MNPLANVDRLNAAFWTGVAGFVLVVIAGLGGIHDGSVWRVPQVLQAKVQTALADAGYPGLSVQMDGQRAIVRGTVENRAAIEAVQRTALKADGFGGPWAGGVTDVDGFGLRTRQPGDPAS